MRQPRGDRGASSLEWTGVLLVAAVVVAALLTTDIPGRMSGGVHRALCTAFSTGCSATTTASSQVSAGTAGSPDDAAGSGDVPCGWTTSGDCAQTQTANSGQQAVQPGQAADPLDGMVLAASSAGGGKLSRLPTGGSYPFVPKRGQRLDNPKNITRKNGNPVDADGNVWEWDPIKGEWDVQTGKKHTNVGPDGEITHGEDNFRKKPRGGGSQSDGGGDGGSDTAKAVAVGGGVVGGGAVLWWLGKLASPACGPLLPVCAVAF